MSDFYKSNLVKANFKDADLYLANFRRANLAGANLRRANFKGAKLDRAIFRGAKHVEDAKFTPSSLKEAIFSKDDMIKLIPKYREKIDRDQFGENLLQVLTEKCKLPSDPER